MAKILIYSSNVIGKSMAGAAIRPWEFAKELSKGHQVVLLTPNLPDLESKNFEIIPLKDPKTKKHFKTAKVLIVQRLTFPLAFMAKRYGLKIIIDAYVPGPLELLEHFKHDQLDQRESKVRSEITNVSLSFQMADGILCASEKQKEFWLGFLTSQKLISPTLYDINPTLDHFLAIVPFGLPSNPPKKISQGLKEKFGFSDRDKIILWGGGIWNWFDPLTLIKAMKLLKDRPEIKLVFMGVKPPDPTLPTTAMSAKAVELAKDLHLLNQTVFFNHDWIPYEERQHFLLDATIGISTHFEHLETRFSFRTRMLDYLWADLPMIATIGDSFAEIISKYQLGTVVPYKNEQALAQAIVNLIDNDLLQKKAKENIAKIKHTFFWPNAIIPLKQMIDRLSDCPPQVDRWQNGRLLAKFLFTKIRERGLKSCLQQYLGSFFLIFLIQSIFTIRFNV